jgi:hypothetical protein
MELDRKIFSYKALITIVSSLLIFMMLSQTSMAKGKPGGGGGGGKPGGKGSTVPNTISVAGDSITMGFAANCTGNVWLWDLVCLLGGDQPEHSWFDGSSSNVNSILDRYNNISRKISVDGNKNAAASGSEMRGGTNNFSIQAGNIVAQNPVPDHVEVLLGGNDICNRGCTDPANCSDPLLTEGQWRESVQAGLDVLVAGMPAGSTIQLNGMPRVQDLYQAGLAKQSGNFDVNCTSVWSTYDICRIVTNSGTMNGESQATRLAAIETAQQRYNEVLSEEANAYNSNSNGQNPNGVEVVSEYVDENTASGGTFSFGGADIDGGDCFHPSVAAQNKIADFEWAANNDR